MNHVNSKVILGLGAATLVAIVAATVLSTNRKPQSESAVTQYALPTLRNQVNEVKRIKLTAAEDKPVVTLVKEANGWTVKEKGSYPADSGKLRSFLLKLQDATLLEQKTANEQRYAELGVEDVKSKEAKSVMVTLEGPAKPAQLIVGNFNGKGNGTFVRNPDDKQSWLAKGNLTVERDPSAWIDKAPVDIAAERMAEIVITKPGGKSLRLFKEQPSDIGFKVADLPKGRELADASTLNGLASTLAGLTLLDVIQADGATSPGNAEPLKAQYRTFDGLTINVEASKQDDKHYARFSALLDQARADAHIQTDQAKAKAEYESKQKSDENKASPPPLAVTDPAKDREQRLAELNGELDRLNQRFANWRLVIPPYKYANMDKSLDDVLKPATASATKEKTPDARQPVVKKR